MTLERYTLERVYYELFGEEKIDVPGEHIWEYWDSDSTELDDLFDYSLDDVVSTLKIAQQTLPRLTWNLLVLLVSLFLT